MNCPGIHCPGCPGGGLTLGPIIGAVVGIAIVGRAMHDPSFVRALDTVLICALIGEALAVVGLVVMLVLVIRADRPRARVAPPAVLRVRAEPIGREPVYMVTTAPERARIESPRVMPLGELAGAHEPARARVVRARRGAGTGPGR